MIAVLIGSTLNPLHPFGLIGVLLLIGIVAGVVASRLGYSRRRVEIALTLMIVLLASHVTYVAICVPCENCDPWWVEWFWICWPLP